MFNNYTPYASYAGPSNITAMYQRQQMPMTSPQMPSQQPYLKGRVVTSVEEVRASQVDLDGSVTYFACPGEGRIYAKGIDMQGLPYILVYELQKVPMPVTGGNGDRSSKEMEDRIVALENKVREMENHVQLTTSNADAG